VYPEECGFRNCVLVIGEIALINACSCRCALAKNFFIVSVFDPVNEPESNEPHSPPDVKTGRGTPRSLYTLLHLCMSLFCLLRVMLFALGRVLT
jgi:hypothetical protein